MSSPTTIHFLWFATSLLVILVSFLYARGYKAKIKAALQRVEESQTKASEEVAKIIRETLSPRVYSRSGQANVTSEAADLVRRAAGEESRDDRFLIIIGAPSMATVAAVNSTAAISGPATSANDYEQALKDSPELAITRYIALPAAPEMKGRRLDLRREYLAWLKKQMSALSQNDKYRLVDVVRAPQYGTNLAKFLTKRSIMEVTGKGEGSVTITETGIAASIRQAAVEAIEGRGHAVQNPPTIYTHGGDLSGLATLIKEIEAVCALS